LGLSTTHRLAKVKNPSTPELRMRAVLIIMIILLAAGAFIWHSHRKTVSDQAALAPATSALATSAQTPSLAPADSSGTATGALESPAAEPPAAVAPIMAKADAMWTQCAGDVNSPNAPTMALLYSQVLQGLYGQPGQHQREQTLVETRLKPLGQALFFSRTRYNDDPSGIFASHVTAPGEAPDGIARKYGMSQQFLNRLRGHTADDGHLNIGDAVKVVTVRDHGGFLLHITKSEFILDCYVCGIFAKRYPISQGSKQTPTPVGKAHVVVREWHPDWTHPVTHQIIHYGDPGHILGPMWLALDAQELGQEGIGIHGYTGENQSSGQLASNGCVRLPNDDAIELYDTLSAPDRSPTLVQIVE
jgi:lipoprotein-anchoring transpeptidase ErfK/SrfK